MTVRIVIQKTILQIFFTVLFGISSRAQLRVANYSCGKPGTDKYEHVEFWTKDGKRTEVSYAYGKNRREIKMQYLGRDNFNGDSTFRVKFSNGYVLFVIPSGLQLKVTDSTRKYNKTFVWEYEGPVNGIGTHCEVCVSDEADAMKLLKTTYLK